MKKLALVPSLLIFLFSCHSAKKDNSITIYSPHGDALLTEMKNRFEKAYPSIKVEYINLTSQEVLERVQNEKGDPQGDIWWGAPSTLFIHAMEDSLLEKYRPAWSSQVDLAYHDPNDYWYGTFLTPEVILYNKSVLKREQAPQDWDDLVTPQWKKRIIIRSPMNTGTIRMIFSALIAREVNESDRYLWLKKLSQQSPEYVALGPELYKGLDEQTPVSIWNMPDIVSNSQRGEPVDYIWPKSGAIVLVDGIGLIKGSDNLDAAKKFYDFVMLPENVKMLAEKFIRIPTIPITPLESQPTWLQNLPANKFPVNWKFVADNEIRWMDQWESKISRSN